MSNSCHAGSMIIFGEALIDAFPDNDRLGGAPFNVARTMRAFDSAALMITRIGADHRGQLVGHEMQRFELDQRACQTDQQHPTGVVQVAVEGGSHRFSIALDQAYDYIDSTQAQSAIDAYLMSQPGVDRQPVFYFGTLAQRHSISRQSLNRLIKANALTKYLDLNLRDGHYTQATISSSLQHADILKINEDELQILIRLFIVSVDDLCTRLTNKAACAAMFAALGQLMALFELGAIIVTLGEHGYVYLDAGGQEINGYALNPDAVDVVDTVGCGDAFSAIFLVGLLHCWPVEITLQRAHAFAAQLCTIQGAVSLDAEFYADWKKQWMTPLHSASLQT